MISISLPDNASIAQLSAAAHYLGLLQKIAAGEVHPSDTFSLGSMTKELVTVNVAETTQDVTSEERAAVLADPLAKRVNDAFEDAMRSGTTAALSPLAEMAQSRTLALDAASIFGGAAAPAPLPEPSATAALVPAPSSTIPEPSSAPAAAVPGPVITDAAAAIGLPSPTPTTSGPALDKEGLPWDHRIHAESKAQNQDGTWRKKRGVTDEEFARVKGEMKAMLGGVQVPGPTAASGVTAPPEPAATPTPPAPAAPTGDSGYGAMMLWLNGPMTSQPQKITMADLSSTIANCAPIFGIEPPAGGFNISTIKLAPAPLIAMIRAELGTLAASRGWTEEVAS